jgi:uncharacterized protein
MYLLTALMIGFVGSLHCIGMCGPIALALPFSGKGTGSLIFGRFVYNFGRVITYSFLGLIFGLFGNRISAFGSQQILSISIGAIIIISAFITLKFKSAFLNKSGFSKIFDKLKNLMVFWFDKHSMLSLFVIGILNGFLPCGLVYVAIAGAVVVSSENFMNAVFYMSLFGLGTIPAMWGIAIIGNYINIGIRRKLTRIVPVFVVILGIIFILRGLNLGIPYISPSLKKLNTEHNNSIECH